MKISIAKIIAMLGTSALSLSVMAQAPAKNLSQQQLADFAGQTELRLGVISNFTPAGDGMKGHIHLQNRSNVGLPAGESNWKIYLHSVRGITADDTAGLHLKHVQGDLHELSPTKAFAGLAPGASVDFPFNAAAWMVSYTDFMPRAFIAQGTNAVVFANTDTEQLTNFVDPITKPEQQQRFGIEKKDLYPIATAATRYQDNLASNQIKVSAADVAKRIIPAPKSMKLQKGVATIDSSWEIRYSGRLTQEAGYLQKQLKAAGVDIKSQLEGASVEGGSAGGTGGSKVILLAATAKSPTSESYELTIAANKVAINGSDNAGTFYGIQSLLALLPVERSGSYELPQLTLSDSPRFNWRGMEYDMARNFHGKAVTLRLIDQMARYKLNKLHLHLTDDEGWRLQIPGLPELTEVGGSRCFDLSEQHCLLTQLGTGPSKSGSGNGYYTTADFIAIVKYADARHIEVIPEIDMPGHSRASVKSMEARYKKLMAAGQKAAAEQYLLSDPLDKSQYKSVQNYTDNAVNVCLPSTYVFADKVIYELQQMYRAAGVKLSTFHMGGDEVGKGSWEQSPACHALFAKGEKGVAGPADLKPYFVTRIAELTNLRGLSLAGWEDGLMYDPVNTFNRKQFANENVIANAWDNIWEWGVADRAYRLANAGYQVILSPGTHLYFDHPHEANPEERGYYWATRYSDTGKVFSFMPDNYYANAERTNAGAPITDLEALVGREMPPLKKPENIIGVQGQLWSETVRTPEQLELMIYPRVIALAERAWSKGDWEGDKPNVQARQQAWAVFANTLSQKELPKLAAAGAGFYLPPPGAILENGKLLANTSYPGLKIEYSEDKGASWQTFNGPVAVSTPVLLRSVSGAVHSRVTNLE